MVLGAFVAGAVGAGLGAVAARFVPAEKKTLRIACVVLGVTLVTPLLQMFVIKPYEVDAALQETQVFRVIKERDPETYAGIRKELVTAARLDDEALRSRVRERVGQLARKYVPSASDDALCRFITVFLAELDQIRSKDPVAAQAYLFPAKGQAVDMTKYVDARTLEEEVAAIAGLIETGAGASPREDDPQRADELLQAAVARLAKVHGQDVQLLTRPTAPETDPAKLTAVVSGLYREILTLPAADSAIVLRKLLAD